MPRQRELSEDDYRALARAMNVDPSRVDMAAILALHRGLLSGADKLLEIRLRDVEPAFSVAPGREWR